MPDRADPNRSHALPVGTVLVDTYRVTGLLAEPGPHAIVYEAVTAAGDEVAVKELFPRALTVRAAGGLAAKPHDADAAGRLADARRRFLLEAQVLESLSNPALPTARAHFEANGTAYLVTDLVRGRSLEDRLQAGRLSIAEVRSIVIALIDAVEVLHAHGILHRDIAPANVLLASDGTPRLLGLATPRQLLMYGMPGAVAPRPGYAAIEMYGSRGKGPWTDVHAVAALLYRLLTGSLPASAVDRAAGEALVPPSRLVPGVPWALDALIVKGLAQRPEERPHSAERFRALLDEALEDSRQSDRGAGVSPSFGQPAIGAPTPGFSHSGITPLTVPAITPRQMQTPFSFPGMAVAPLSDEEMLSVAAPAPFSLAQDPTGSTMVIPEADATSRRRLRFGGVAAAAAIVLWAGFTFARSSDAGEGSLPMASGPRHAPPLAQSAPLTQPTGEITPPSSEIRGGDVRQQGEPAAVLAPTPAASEATERPRTRQAEIVVPRIRVPVISTPTPMLATQAVPAEVLVQLRDELATARVRVEAGDYASAQRIFRNALTRADGVASKHMPSAVLTTLRRDIEQASQRALEACAAVNAIAARRNGRVVACE